MKCSALWSLSDLCVACENIRFSSLFAAGDVSRETFPAAKSEEKRMFSQANLCDMFLLAFLDLTVRKVK